MFLEFYGLREQPFGVTPNPRFLYPSPSHREALASLMYAIQSDLGFSALIAEPGMGKTTLLFDLLERYRRCANTAFLFNTQCKSRDFMRYLLTELEVEHPLEDTVSMHEKFKEVLLQSARDNKKVLIVIDEAHNLQNSILETVRLLSNFETTESKLLHIILSGQNDLAERFMRPELTQLFQRVSTVNRLQPFTFEETCAYIDHRLKVAGYLQGPIFDRNALAKIAEYSQGVPRAINRLCFASMSIACALGRASIDVSIVDEVRADLNLHSIQSKGPVFRERPSASPEHERVVAVGAAVSAPTNPSPPAPASIVGNDAVAVQPPPTPPSIDRSVTASNHQTADPELENLRSIVLPQRPAGKAALREQQKRADARFRYKNLATISLIALCLLITGLVLRRMPALIQSVVHELNRPAQASDTASTTIPAPAPVPESSKAEKPKRQRLSAVSDPSKKRNTTFMSPVPEVKLPSFSNAEAFVPGPPLKPANSSQSASTPIKVEEPVPPPVSVASARHDSDPLGSVMDNVLSYTPNVSADLQQKDSAALLVPGRLVNSPRPVYPENAKRLGVEGAVLLSAVIGKDGSIKSVQTVAGNPILASAAENAVRKWKYKPSTINGQPVEVDTQIKVNFNLGSNK